MDVTVLFAPTSGGVRRYLLAKHRWLSRQGALRHTLLVPGPQDAGLPEDIVTLRSPAPPFGSGYRLPLRLRAFRQRLWSLEPDLIEVGDPYQLARPSLGVADELGIPAVAFCHSNVVALARSALGAWSERYARRYLARLYARFALVLAPSAQLASQLRDWGLPDVQVQPLGVDTTVFHPRAADPGLRYAMGIRDDARLLVFAGRLSPEKRIPVLREALRRLGPRYHLLLVGSGGRERAVSNITQVSYQYSPAQVARILASADALVHAGDQETFGLVVLEALACGLPVIASRAGALPELVDEAVGGTFAPGDPHALARAVAALFDRDLAGVRRAARARAEAYAWDAVLRQLLERYRRLLGRGGPATEEIRRAG